MSGHSKWKNIMHKKGKTDAQRAKLFTKVGKEIMMAVRDGGSADPQANSRLRDVITKAKAQNVPNDNIDRLIAKAKGAGNTESYEKIVYEGYGPGGVAVIVETATDNRNRTAGDMRHYFDKSGGNLGQTGSVGYLFSRKGVLTLDGEGLDEEQLMMDALEAGAEDVTNDEGVFEVTTEADDFSAVCDALTKAGYVFTSAQVEQVPSVYVTLTDEEQTLKFQKLLDMLDENDDVTDVWHNCD